MAEVVGGIQDVQGSQNSVAIDNLARFAVEDYNKKQRLVKAARVGDVYELHNLLEADPEILERVSLAHFSDSALHVAALCGKADFVEQIVTRKPSLATDTNQKGMIPLHLASLQGHVETVRELLKAKLEDGVNQCLLKDDEGWNPLHCASQKGKIMAMEELIRECPECLEQVTEKGETVLHLAVKANQFGAVKVLAGNIKRHNLQILLKSQDQKGKSAYQLAAAKRQFQVLEILKEDEKGDDEIREESRINVKGDGNDDSEESEKEESNVCHHQFLDAILIVAALIITLTYQALANPPSTFLKDGNTTINWSCINQRSSSQGFIKHLKECPAVLALLFMIFNTLIFFQSIFTVVNTLPGTIRIPVRLFLLFLVLCYSFLLTAFYSNALYFAFPFALLVIFFFFFSRIHGDPEPLIITIFRLYILQFPLHFTLMSCVM